MMKIHSMSYCDFVTTGPLVCKNINTVGGWAVTGGQGNSVGVYDPRLGCRSLLRSAHLRLRRHGSQRVNNRLSLVFIFHEF